MITSKVLLRRRRSGTVIVYITLALVVLLGAAGLSIDIGNLYLERDKAQRAADAAALAGAVQLMNNRGYNTADAAAKLVAKENGYDDSAEGITVTPTPKADGNDAWYAVYVEKPAPVFFMSIFGWRFKTVAARAIATFKANVQMDINGGGTYGAIGPINLSVFGPYCIRANGDKYSTMYIDNKSKRTPNPFYDAEGYNFNLTIPSDYEDRNNTSLINLQIFDPDCYNAGNEQNAKEGVRVDEMRNYSGSNTSDTKYLTTTQYTLYDTHGTAATDDDTIIAQASYGNDSKTDMTWVTPEGFNFDLSQLSGDGPHTVRINVKTTDGSSENGFSLRAGPPIYYGKNNDLADIRQKLVTNKWGNKSTQYKYVVNGREKGDWMTTDPFQTNNGTNITADGRIPMNFNANGTATITLGLVPENTNHVTIDKFDTDVGSTSVTYDDGIQTRVGVLSGQDESKQDDYDLPEGYSGREWTATYKAGLGDTSVWDMQVTGASASYGRVYLVR